MQSVGHSLREARERRGLSLETISADTRIPLKNLQAIENDDVSHFQSAFFYKSFVRQFAAALEVSYSAIEAAVTAAAGEIPRPRMPGEDHHTIHVAPMKPARGSAMRWISPVFSLIAVCAVCSGLYAVLQKAELPHLGSFQARTADLTHDVADFVHDGWQSASTLVTHKSTAPSSARAEKSQNQSPASVPDKVEQATANIPGENILLRIAAVEKTWLSVDADGKPVYTGLLDPHDSKTLAGRDTARIRTGNAGGLTVMFNGKEIGPLGERGQVRTVVFTRDQYEILEPNLTSRLELLRIHDFTE